MEVDDHDATDTHGVTKARSAYTYFMTMNGGIVKESEGSALAALAAKVRTFHISFFTLITAL